ncbi:FG-GAP repeat protein [Streptomyces sp. NPDC052701]|uniref:FG-GAP repeat protein n=1 Tax=Streptomyces sp. NPDC052701 TaxID=3155533 RepID=UPI0034361140
MSRRRSAAVTAASFLLVTGAVITAAPAAFASAPGGVHAGDRNSDFNGDGYDDVLTGAPGGTDGGHEGSGYVTVQYGSVNGMGTATAAPRGRTAVFSQSTAGVPGTAEAGDGFGTAVATGDLDADGYDDAIVAAPGEDVDSTRNAGRVTVLYGSSSGLTAARSVTVGASLPKADAGFGLALAAARFADGAQGDVLAVAHREGAVLYTYGAGTLKITDRIDTVGAPGGAAIQPASLTTGNYDGDGRADLVVSGRSLEEDGTGQSAVYAGGADGLTYVRDLGGGSATASGDINNDGYDDVVYGRPDHPDDLHEPLTGGTVGVYFGGADGLKGVDEYGTVAQAWTQDTAGVPGTGELGDGFGADVSLADVDADGYDDLVVGAPGEDVGTVADAGGVWVLRGSANGVTAAGVKSYNQDSAGLPGTVEQGDRWGGQVRLADTNRDGRSELLAAAPAENTSDGVVWVLPATASGTTADGSWSYGGASLGAPGTDARFGAAIDE